MKDSASRIRFRGDGRINGRPEKILAVGLFLLSLVERPKGLRVIDDPPQEPVNHILWKVKVCLRMKELVSASEYWVSRCKKVYYPAAKLTPHIASQKPSCRAAVDL